ncbi:MAG: paraslipin [SAR324 cluster bacterium]|nr:paraslipin [SAR324 cluster bacterium]
MFTEQASEYFGYFNLAVWAIIFVTVIYKFSRSIRLVPTQSAYLVERLGKYRSTLGPGIHLLLPFFDQVTFIQDLKEESIGVDPQECFTSDNVKVEVDGVIYLSVTDPVNSSYGVTDYRFAATQLAQTTTRSMIGTLDLDRTFEERDIISAKVVEVLSEVGQGWGITVHRYEIKNIVPPSSVREAMERQVTAERERRAIVARSEGDKQSRINRSEGLKEELVNRSEGEMQRRINEAEGKAEEIEALSKATAESIELLAAAISQKGGKEAVRLQLTQNYLSQLSHLADQETSVLLPADLTQLDDLLGAVGLSGDGGGKA